MSAETEATDGHTIEEAATQLSLTPEQVRDVIAAGALETSGSGDGRRITPESLFRYKMSRLTQDMKQVTARPGGLAVASSALLPLLLAMWYLAICVEVFSLRSGKPIVPAPAAFAGFAAGLALLWWLGRQADDFSTFNGLGTALYGRRMTPEGRVGTQWLVLVGVPLLPLQSYVVLEAGEVASGSVGAVQKRQYRVRPLGRIHWPQALPILAGVWAALGAVLVLVVRA